MLPRGLLTRCRPDLRCWAETESPARASAESPGKGGLPPKPAITALAAPTGGGGGGWQAACVLVTNIRFYVEQRLRKLACKASGIPTPAAAKQTTAGLAQRRGRPQGTSHTLAYL